MSDTVKTALLNNQIGLFPCDTMWGLIGRMHPDVATLLCKVKKRALANGFIVLIPQNYTLDKLCPLRSETATKLIETYWPGPLTLILNQHDHIPKEITGNHNSIAVRMPKDGPIAELLTELQEPLLSTSVNQSGETPHQNIKTVPEAILSAASFCIEAEPNSSNTPSTIINCQSDTPKLIRQGHLDIPL